MSESGFSNAISPITAGLPLAKRTTASDDLPQLLKHCAHDTLLAAQQYRRTRQPELAPGIVRGVMARYVDEAHQHWLGAGNREVRLVEDLGLDSLSLIEISMTLEDVLGIALPEDRLRHLPTLNAIDEVVLAEIAMVGKQGPRAN